MMSKVRDVGWECEAEAADEWTGGRRHSEGLASDDAATASEKGHFPIP